jgi:hypothetical protein
MSVLDSSHIQNVLRGAITVRECLHVAQSPGSTAVYISARALSTLSSELAIPYRLPSASTLA